MLSHRVAPLAALALLAAGQELPAQNQPLLRSPEVHADRRVTVRLRAPNAQKVEFARDGAEPVAMQRDSSGVWSHTTGPLAPDVYPYTFRIDGVAHVDPLNPALKSTYEMGIGQSLLHVSGPDSIPWERTGVPHGVVHHHYYRSAIIGDARDYFVYTPPDYDPLRARPYPVLYLLHGFSDDASAWLGTGRANFILDNLIARGTAEPMVVVMTLGYGAPEIFEDFHWGKQLPDEIWRKNVTHFDSALVGEVMPQIERSYHVSRDREERAIAGLSMGGGQALYSGLRHLDRFAWIGAFSSATDMMKRPFEQVYPAADARLGERAKLVWVAIGRDDFLWRDNVRFRDWMRSRNARFEWVDTDGAHTWMLWRRYLADFAKRLFQ